MGREEQTDSLVEDLVRRLDADVSPVVDEFTFKGPFADLARSLTNEGAAIPIALIAEQIAFDVYASDQAESSSWGLYFGPMMSGLDASGEPADSPPLSAMTPEVLGYWASRARRSAHPVLRARYADLLWEMPRKLSGNRPDAAMARVAIDAYLEAVGSNRYESEPTRVAKAKRALSLALSVSDAKRIERARDTLLSLDEEGAFDTLLESPNPDVPLSADQIAGIIRALETRLARAVVAGSAREFPYTAEEAATRLARYYRRTGQPAEMARVLESLGDAVRAMKGFAPPFLVAHSVERLYELFQSFGLSAQADGLNDLLRIVGEQSMSDMKTITAEVQTDREKVEMYFADMLKGEAKDVLERIAAQFIPDRQKLDDEMRKIATKAPLLYIIPHEVKDDDGRTIARIGPLEADGEGQLVHHIAQHLSISVQWLRELLRRASDLGLATSSTIMEFLFRSPLYQGKRRSLIEAGLRCYHSGDAVGAIHILIPQVEQAVRQLATLLKAPIYSRRRGGGLHLRTLDELLRDEQVVGTLGENISSYFRILFTDARGWNLRNDVCHGLASNSVLSMAGADRVVHAMLVLALFREKSPAESS